MNSTGVGVLFVWPILVQFLFVALGPRRAVIAAFVIGWLFLPVGDLEVSVLPGTYSKLSATVYSVLLGLILFDMRRLVSFRPQLVDIPMLVWCVVPIASSLTNGLGVYDGVSLTLSQTVTWGLPYLFGRLYFSDRQGLRELAIGIFVGGLVYVPFCLYEVRMSPQLHSLVYGAHQHSWAQTIRMGGWRPDVFMAHGLMVGMWLCVTTLIGFHLWRTKALVRLARVPVSLLVLLLGLTAVLAKSTGALALLAIGLGVLIMTKWTGWRVGMLVLLACPLAYMGARAGGLWDGAQLLSASEIVTGSEERVGSLGYRLDAEDILIEHARERPFFGWGTWGRNHPARMGIGQPELATDGFWIIAFGQRGLVGLSAVMVVLLLPAYILLRNASGQTWKEPESAPAVALALGLLLFAIDSLFNHMFNPIYVLAAGAMISGEFVRDVDPSNLRSSKKGVGPSVQTPRPAQQAASRALRPIVR
jgi:hypothetical protein